MARHNWSHHPDDDTLIKKKRISSKKVSKPECKSTKSEYTTATLDESFETDADMESPAGKRISETAIACYNRMSYVNVVFFFSIL